MRRNRNQIRCWIWGRRQAHDEGADVDVDAHIVFSVVAAGVGGRGSEVGFFFFRSSSVCCSWRGLVGAERAVLGLGLECSVFINAMRILQGNELFFF